MATCSILKKLEPIDKLLAPLLCPGGCARADIAQHANRLIEGFPIVLVQCGTHDLSLQVSWDLVHGARSPRLRRRHRLLRSFDLSERRAHQPAEERCKQ